jgi:hypothetical protein
MPGRVRSAGCEADQNVQSKDDHGPGGEPGPIRSLWSWRVALSPCWAGQGTDGEGDKQDIFRKTVELTNRSRLGCQVFLTKSVDGMIAKLPSATRNMYVDGEYLPVRLIVWSRY